MTVQPIDLRDDFVNTGLVTVGGIDRYGWAAEIQRIGQFDLQAVDEGSECLQTQLSTERFGTHTSFPTFWCVNGPAVDLQQLCAGTQPRRDIALANASRERVIGYETDTAGQPQLHRDVEQLNSLHPQLEGALLGSPNAVDQIVFVQAGK